jgi:hypothetical protein
VFGISVDRDNNRNLQCRGYIPLSEKFKSDFNVSSEGLPRSAYIFQVVLYPSNHNNISMLSIYILFLKECLILNLPQVEIRRHLRWKNWK